MSSIKFVKTIASDPKLTFRSTAMNGEERTLRVLNISGSWPCLAAIYTTLATSSTLITRLLNNEAEIAKGTVHVNWGMILSVHVRATASEERISLGVRTVR